MTYSWLFPRLSVTTNQIFTLASIAQEHATSANKPNYGYNKQFYLPLLCLERINLLCPSINFQALQIHQVSTNILEDIISQNVVAISSRMC